MKSPYDGIWILFPEFPPNQLEDYRFVCCLGATKKDLCPRPRPGRPNDLYPRAWPCHSLGFSDQGPIFQKDTPVIASDFLRKMVGFFQSKLPAAGFEEVFRFGETQLKVRSYHLHPLMWRSLPMLRSFVVSTIRATMHFGMVEFWSSSACHSPQVIWVVHGNPRILKWRYRTICKAYVRAMVQGIYPVMLVKLGHCWSRSPTNHLK